MKNIITTFIVVLIAVAGVSAQQSDYEINKEFETRTIAIKKAISESKNVRDVDSLLLAIDELALDFQLHSQILDFGLYPESYQSSIASLKGSARAAEYKLLIIENQAERLSLLSNQVSSYKIEIANLTQKGDSLRREIIASQESEERLAELVKEYRRSVEQRDDFIFGMIDSLFVTYRSLGQEEIFELAKQKKNSGVVSENPLYLLSSIIKQNIESLKVETNTLFIEDYLRNYVLQKKIENAWKQIGDDLVLVYGNKDNRKWKTGISEELKVWKTSISYSMWTSLDDYMEGQGVDIGAFDDNKSFFNSLDGFITTSINESDENILTSTTYDDFLSFSEFWQSKVLDEWNHYLVQGELLTVNQIATIDTKVDDWREHSKPVPGALIILFGIGFVALIGFVVALVKK